MEISRIYVTVDNVDYRLLGSELSAELDEKIKELVFRSLLKRQSAGRIIAQSKRRKTSFMFEDGSISSDPQPSISSLVGIEFLKRLKESEYITSEKNGNEISRKIIQYFFFRKNKPSKPEEIIERIQSKFEDLDEQKAKGFISALINIGCLEVVSAPNSMMFRINEDYIEEIGVEE